MFNVIVSSGLKDPRQGKVFSSRVFGYTAAELSEKFMPSGVLDVAAVAALPTLLMEEGTDDQVAGVAWLSGIVVKGRDYEFSYTLDPDIPKLTNSEVYELRSELEMEEFEFSTNHWAVKKADLFQVLYRKRFASQSKSTVFELSQKPINPKLISFMMPFAPEFDDVYKDLKLALEADGFVCKRADDMWVNAHIMSDIIELICTSAVIVCDLSRKNPNVFYEAGIAHTLGREVVLITQSDDDVPFDLRSIRYISYSNNFEGRPPLVAKVVERVKAVV